MTRPLDQPIAYEVKRKRLADLTLGYHAPDHMIDFDWRPYEKRRPEAREDYDRLEVSIRREGIRKPLITFQDCVLIGMRRAEIGVKLGIEWVNVWEVQEDVSKWTALDIERLMLMKKRIGEHDYNGLDKGQVAKDRRRGR